MLYFFISVGHNKVDVNMVTDTIMAGRLLIILPDPFLRFITETVALTTEDIDIVSIGPMVYNTGVSSISIFPGGLSIFNSSSTIVVRKRGERE